MPADDDDTDDDDDDDAATGANDDGDVAPNSIFLSSFVFFLILPRSEFRAAAAKCVRASGRTCSTSS